MNTVVAPQAKSVPFARSVGTFRQSPTACAQRTVTRCLLSNNPFSKVSPRRANAVDLFGKLGESLKCRAMTPKTVPETEEGSGGGDDGADGGSNGGGGDGGDSGESGDGGLSPGVAALLAQAGRTIESFPADFSAALAAGKVTEEILQRYLAMEKNFFLNLLFKIAGFRNRLLADPSFLFKVGLECGIGIFTKSTAEYNKRKDSFWGELDFVLANVIMAILADFMLVWLPAPTLVYQSTKSSSKALLPFMSNLPDNAFQVVQPGTEPFTVAQRGGAILRNGAKLLGVGLVCSLAGVMSTNCLIWVREQLDPNFKNANPPQDPVTMSLAYGSYMAVSANLRYQVIAGILEQRGIERVFLGNPQLCKALSFVLRTGNTYLGSLLWVDYIRLLGLQKGKSGEEEIAMENPGKKK